MAPRKLKYVNEYRSRGRVFRYFRRGGKQWRLREDPATPAFWRRYAELLAETEPEAAPEARKPPKPGTIEDLVQAFKSSAEWQAFAPGTRRNYELTLKDLEPIMPVPATAIERRHVVRLRDKVAGRAQTAGERMVEHLRSIYAWGIAAEFGIGRHRLRTNPCAGIKRIHTTTPHKAWSAAEHAAVEALRMTPGFRTAYMLATYTGQRQADILAIRPDDYDGEGVSLTQRKTGVALWIPVHPALKEHLDAIPRDGRETLVVNHRGRPYTPNTFSSLFGDMLRAAGLEHLTFHGLRHSTGSRLAEAGCSASEIQSILGHTTLKSSSHYTKQADQRTRARAAIEKLTRKP